MNTDLFSFFGLLAAKPSSSLCVGLGSHRTSSSHSRSYHTEAPLSQPVACGEKNSANQILPSGPAKIKETI